MSTGNECCIVWTEVLSSTEARMGLLNMSCHTLPRLRSDEYRHILHSSPSVSVAVSVPVLSTNGR
jgi:hypothetical protein